MRVGFVGCGSIASVHLQAVSRVRGAEIVGVADKSVSRARAFAAQHGIRGVSESTERLIDEWRPQVVHVLTPPEIHYETALECLLRGVHVLVEKPLALTSEQCQELTSLAKRKDLLLTVDHNMQFLPVVQRARRLLARGKIGDLVTLEVDYGFDANRYPAILHPGAPSSHWAFRLNGGPVEDQMAHPLSLIMAHIDKVKDVVVAQRNRGVLPQPWCDEIRVILDAEPVHAEVYVSFGIKPDAYVVTMRGTEGTITADLYSLTVNVDPHSVLPRSMARGSLAFCRGFQAIEQGFGNLFRLGLGRVDKTGGVSAVVKGFYRSIETGASLPVPMEEGARVVSVIQRIWPEPLQVPRSRSGRMPHQIPPGPPSVLVTGGSGFIGSHLVKRLVERGESVRALVRPGSRSRGLLDGLPIDIFHGDLADAQAVNEAMDGIKTVYHAGGAMSGGWEDHKHSTVEGTRNVVNAAVANEVRRFIHFSSLVVYDLSNVSDGTSIEEQHPQDGSGRLGPYSRGKVAAEAIVDAAYREQGLATTIVRPGIVIGSRRRIFFPHMGYRLHDRAFIVLGKGNLRLPLVYIDNLVEGILAITASETTTGKSYNIIDDGKVTVMDYLAMYREQSPCDVKVIRVPFILPYCASALYEMISALGMVKKGVTSRAQMRWKQKNVIYSNQASKRDFGYTSQAPLDMAVRRTFDRYLHPNTGSVSAVCSESNSAQIHCI